MRQPHGGKGRARARLGLGLASISIAAATVIFAETAAANGRYPEANQLVVGVVDPARILVRATFGFSISADAGAT